MWVSYVPLFPLALLMLTGLYLFALPYVSRGAAGDAPSRLRSEHHGRQVHEEGRGEEDREHERIEANRPAHRGSRRLARRAVGRIRKLIHEVDPAVVEEWKWMGTPVWSHAGMYALANAHKDKVKLTFFHGAKLPDPKKLFNAGLTGGKWRAIDFARATDRQGRAQGVAARGGGLQHHALGTKEQRFESLASTVGTIDVYQYRN